MPLIPMPPIPTKWTCWGLKNISYRYCFGFHPPCQCKRGFLLSSRRRFEHVGRALGRSGLGKCAHALPHRKESLRTKAQGLYFTEQTLAIHLAIEHHARRARFDQFLGVAALMIVGGEWQWD